MNVEKIVKYSIGGVIFMIKKTKYIILNRHNVSFKYISLFSAKSSIRVARGGYLSFGKLCTMESGSYIGVRKGGHINLGDGVYINRNTIIVSHDNISIGNGVTIGPGCYIYDHDHAPETKSGFKTATIKIGKNVWIGANVVLLKGITVGDNSTIGAGSVVVKNVPENAIVVGNPAKVIKYKSNV